MKANVRQEVDGVVLRLFVTQADAQEEAPGWEKGEGERFIPTLHESQNGWVLKGEDSGEVVDAAGKVEIKRPRASARP